MSDFRGEHLDLEDNVPSLIMDSDSAAIIYFVQLSLEVNS